MAPNQYKHLNIKSTESVVNIAIYIQSKNNLDIKNILLIPCFLSLKEHSTSAGGQLLLLITKF